MTPDFLNTMSGLDYMRRWRDGQLPPPPIATFMGFHVTEVEDGRVVFEATPQPDHGNPMGTTHGGWYGTILDSALGCAVMTKLPRGKVYTTLEYKVNLIRGIASGTPARAIGTADHVGRSSGVASAELRGVEDGRLYATATTTCLVMTLPD